MRISRYQNPLSLIPSLISSNNLGSLIAVITKKSDGRLIIASGIRDYSEEKEVDSSEKELRLLLINGAWLYLPNASLEDTENYCTFNNRTYREIFIRLRLC